MIRDRLMTVLWMGVGAGVAMMVAGSAQTSKTDVIKAQRIILRDDSGTPRIELTADNKAGGPFIALLDDNGGARLVFRLMGLGQPRILLFGETGSPLAQWTLDEMNQPELTMKGTNSTLNMGVGKKGEPYFHLYGKNPEIWLDDHYTEASKIISLEDEPIPKEATP